MLKVLIFSKIASDELNARKPDIAEITIKPSIDTRIGISFLLIGKQSLFLQILMITDITRRMFRQVRMSECGASIGSMIVQI
ncbi:MAG: hypothetical protein HY738_24480 [Bacteroidia bacterium]|nr:hypothetical protein [Bacteroidia bacterium]